MTKMKASDWWKTIRICWSFVAFVSPLDSGGLFAIPLGGNPMLHQQTKSITGSHLLFFSPFTLGRV